MHGVVESSGTWVVNPSSRSLGNYTTIYYIIKIKPTRFNFGETFLKPVLDQIAILLAAQSYDVWLGNFRGNRYSKSHIRLSPKQAQFWKFRYESLNFCEFII
jgi:lysosomal acid lipase/cholesteryl ester hydrolase